MKLKKLAKVLNYAFVRSDRLEERREVMQRWCGVVPKRWRRFAVIIFVT